MTIKLPKSKPLIAVILLMALGTIVTIRKISYHQDPTILQSLAGDYIIRLFLGAFWSDFQFFYVPAMILSAIFVTAVIIRCRHSRDIANFAAYFLFGWSVLCIWVEPWLSISGIVFNVVLIILGLFGVIFEIIASVGWFFLWGLALTGVNEEFPITEDQKHYFWD